VMKSTINIEMNRILSDIEREEYLLVIIRI
jgi:hypothetical protein